MQPEHSLSGMLCSVRKGVTLYCSGNGDNMRQAMFRVDLMFFQVCLIQSQTALNLNPQTRKGHMVMLN